jgi:hypothetical protein
MEQSQSFLSLYDPEADITEKLNKITGLEMQGMERELNFPFQY